MLEFVRRETDTAVLKYNILQPKILESCKTVLCIIHDYLLCSLLSTFTSTTIATPPKMCVLGDIWFGNMPTCLELKKKPNNPILVGNQDCKIHPKEFLRETMRDYLSGSHMVLESNIRCRCNYFGVQV